MAQAEEHYTLPAPSFEKPPKVLIVVAPAGVGMFVKSRSDKWGTCCTEHSTPHQSHTSGPRLCVRSLLRLPP